ncbi:MAG: LamG-like jellyroll fold domain-containing protein [Sedimentisphaeraceae bacterium JB056]
MDLKKKITLILMVIFYVLPVSAVVISPDDIDGLSLWFDGSDVNGDSVDDGGVYNNTQVETWVNKAPTGSDYNATQSVALQRPYSLYDSFNQTSSFDFNNYNYPLNNEHFVLDYPSSPNHTVFIVAAVIDGGAQANSWSAILSINAASTANSRMPHIFVRSTGQIGVGYYSNTGSNEGINLPTDIKGDWSIISLTHNNGDNALCYVDGQNNWFSQTVNPFSQDSVDLGVDRIGADNSDRGFQGQIAEIIMYDRALSEEEENLVGYYLQDKYGLVDSTYVDAPLKVGSVIETDGDTIVEEGGIADTFSVVLDSQPTDSVTVTLSTDISGQIQLTPASLTFTSSLWDQPQQITVSAIDDSDIEDGFEDIEVSFTLSSNDQNFSDPQGTVQKVTVTVIDNEDWEMPAINDMVAWFDASDIDGDGNEEGLSEDGLVDGAVETWKNKVTSIDAISDAYQDQSAIRPVYATDSALEYLDFQGTQYLKMDWDPMPDHTIFAIFETTASPVNDWGAIISLNNGSSANSRTPHFFVRSNGDVDVDYVSNTGDHYPLDFGGGCAGSLRFSCIYHENGEAANGIFDDRTLTPSSAFTQEAIFKDIGYIGSTLERTDLSLTGKIAEIIVFDRALEASERQIVGYYLTRKYGLNTLYNDRPAYVVGVVNESDGDSVIYEQGATSDTFEVVLTRQPVSDVTVDLAIDDAADATLSLSQLTFTSANWDQPQQVTVTAIDDALEEGYEDVKISFTLTSSDPAFTSSEGQMVPLFVTVEDNDTPEISVDQNNGVVVSENGDNVGNDQFSVRLLSPPAQDVYISMTTRDDLGDPGEISLSTSMLTFTASDFNIPQVVTVAAIDDEDAEANPHSGYVVFSTTSADTDYDSYVIDDLQVSILENDCGMGPFLDGDVNEDCNVDIADIAMLALDWAKCSTPEVAGCINLSGDTPR